VRGYSEGERLTPSSRRLPNSSGPSPSWTGRSRGCATCAPLREPPRRRGGGARRSAVHRQAHMRTLWVRTEGRIVRPTDGGVAEMTWLLEVLSARLRERVGRGYSTTNLRYFRTFYLAYRDRSRQFATSEVANLEARRRASPFAPGARFATPEVAFRGTSSARQASVPCSRASRPCSAGRTTAC